jgi:hypothetical protein
MRPATPARFNYVGGSAMQAIVAVYFYSQK